MHKTQCPACAEEGRDRSGDNLTVYDDGGSHCFACGYNTQAWEKQEEMVEKPKKSVTTDITGLPVASTGKRGIHHSIYEMYGVRTSHNEETGAVEKIYYPHYNGAGEIVGYKERNLTKPKKEAFLTAGDRSRMFGRNTPGASAGHRLLVTEGEEDALAAKHMLTIGIVPQDIVVVSLPNGASLDKATTSQLDYFKGFKTVHLCLDNDGAGKSATEEIAAWLSQSTMVKVVDLPVKFGKDASDFLQGGHTMEFLKAIKYAKQYMPLGIVNGDELKLDDLLTAEEEGYPIPFRGLNSAIHGLRKGEIVTICADSGVGKTTFSREIAKSLIEQELGVATIALEDQLKVTAKSLIALDMNIPLNEFRFKPPPKSECQPSFDKLIAGGNSYFYKHDGNLDNASLLTTLSAYARSRTVDFIILDHIGVALAGTENSRMGEAKAIDILMNKLASLVTETGVGIIIVAHLKRQTDGVVHEEGREIKLTDLRGSAALEQYAFAVVGLERQQQAEDEEDNNKVRVRLLKNRVFGRTGVVDKLLYVPTTGRLINMPLPPPIILGEEEDDTDRKTA
jgi:twinkle protein